MYLSKFRIQNFKSFDDVTFHFHEKVNILTGVNNSGKTSVLEALALWQELYALLLQEAGRSVKGKYTKGQYILGTIQATYVLYSELLSAKNPHYLDVFRNLDKDLEIRLTITLCHANGSLLDIGFWLKYSAGQTNYNIRLLDFDTFNFQLFNDPSFITNHKALIQTILTIPVSNIVPREEIKRPAVIRRYVSARDSREVLRNRLRDLKNRREDKYFKLLADLEIIFDDAPNSVDLQQIGRASCRERV